MRLIFQVILDVYVTTQIVDGWENSCAGIRLLEANAYAAESVQVLPGFLSLI